jgi:hypothetical protein
MVVVGPMQAVLCGGACWSDGSSSHGAGTFLNGVLVEYGAHAVQQWCVGLVQRMRPLVERGALVVVSGGACWGDDSSSHEAGSSWEAVLVEGMTEKTSTEHTLLGSGVWCSSRAGGPWAREAHLLWC